MRISFILSSLWLSGGVRVIVEYANRLTERGHHITLVAPGGTLDPDMLNELVSAVKVQQSQVILCPKAGIIHKVRLAWSLARSVPDSDVVISTHTPTTVVGLLATRLWRRGRLVWLYQDHPALFSGQPVESWLLRNAARWHEKVLVISEWCRQEISKHLGQKPVVVVGQGLSHAEVFRPIPRKQEDAGKSPQTILFLGDKRPRKGLYDFLTAIEHVYERHRDIQVLVVSKEPCDITSNVPLEYLYRPNRKELAKLYATCDLFVSASWLESFGLPPLEAMACGAPVVLTDSGGVRDYARPDENCQIVPPREPAALAEAMYRVLNDSELARRLAANGPPTAAQFTWDRAVGRFEAAIVDLLESNHG